MGRTDVKAMLKEMPFPVFLGWQAFDTIEPIGGIRGDLQAASVCATVMNATAIRARSKARFHVKDFVLEYGVEKKKTDDAKEGGTTTTPTANPPRKTVEEMKFIARMMTAAANADEGKKKKHRR